MSSNTVENILKQISELPLLEQIKIREALDEQPLPAARPKPPLDKVVPPIPAPDYQLDFKWLAEHAREYAGQWVALSGGRLIAHGFEHDEVWAAAQADGAYLPLVTIVEDPDAPPFAGF